MHQSVHSTTERILHWRVRSHPSIVTIRGNVDHPRWEILLFHFVKDGDLHAYLSKNKPLTNNELSSVISQLVSAILHCHVKGIAHRDIKLENVLVDVGEAQVAGERLLKVFLSDFGLATQSVESKSFLLGTTTYMSPEVETGSSKRGDTYSPFESDVWSLGMTLLLLITGGNRP